MAVMDVTPPAKLSNAYKLRLLAAGLLLVALVSLTSFSTTAAAQIDAEITAERPITRIISLAPSLTELIYSAGAGDYLVGAVSYSDYPPEAQRIPRVGDFNALNIERIIKLKPDLILSWQSGTSARDTQRLKQLGLPLLIHDTQQLDDIPKLIAEIGQLTGQQDTANTETERLRYQLNTLRQKYEHASAVSVFYQVWHQPLITVNGAQFMGQAIAICGGVNIFADQMALAPHVSREAVINENPDVILLGGKTANQQAWLSQWQTLPFLAASQNQHIYLLDSDQYQRPTARLIDSLDALCQLIDHARQPTHANP
ncbi:cobalamin-binding protein [Thiomicrospira cyclica]|uniref:ABC-type transporter, periplasmic subunit n=1 Tax=Thiomicrospira cyclica (strain DSM 14477 / JCM 11371 / ALM1) TaxID=717773 RepID=F6DBV7_THICA|nr:cobalamin-binding protein [Thiomicrospira cyclica]AEG31343.1 ABC-type transporter, periplasmic subunit [Thiomicrospira cyclica ALM1]